MPPGGNGTTMLIADVSVLDVGEASDEVTFNLSEII
jgi:hypothetical protein